MRKFRKNLFLGVIIIAASITGYFLQEKEQRSYILEIDSKAGETLPAEIPSDGSNIATYKNNSSSPDTTSELSGNEKNEKKVNLNTATKDELMRLDHIGEVKAERIIQYRESNGNFEVIEDIMKIDGIGKKTFNKLKDYITVE